MAVYSALYIQKIGCIVFKFSETRIELHWLTGREAEVLAAARNKFLLLVPEYY
jgi:hypothetical protein